MALYGDSTISVPEDAASVHEEDLANLAHPGAWWDGPQRRAIASAARAARCDAKLQAPTRDTEKSEAPLPAAVGNFVGEVATRAHALDRASLEPVLGDGLSDAACVEIVGVVARVVNHDVFARGLGIPSRGLSAPAPGEPSRTRPDTAIDEGGFLPSIPSGRRGGEEGRALYGEAMQPFIYRALSLVPDEARRNMRLGDAQYLPIDSFFDFGYSHHPSLTRAQVEAIAGRVSALNECFY